ncbi:hypothetical protein PPL_01434 [Heterostelium album PN500]|uniref:Uncharacterized protein n=1 Tax=Heterostelium pallidum (strain ATCC 26659 / Pp 5 / PN500) TaxID=670386 RepID=D3AZ94_HETP5|nr:hypothetical protein PPL_01434 [Heterostelium album PN500]EFA85477.1 hypothetical protein PPL_01434 [Heterostelium album PN500]|eukprot:XP_020437585.1 hypothetical protein PPL_01434 [Heterostelium album PN500]
MCPPKIYNQSKVELYFADQTPPLVITPKFVSSPVIIFEFNRIVSIDEVRPASNSTFGLFSFGISIVEIQDLHFTNESDDSSLSYKFSAVFRNTTSTPSVVIARNDTSMDDEKLQSDRFPNEHGSIEWIKIPILNQEIPSSSSSSKNNNSSNPHCKNKSFEWWKIFLIVIGVAVGVGIAGDEIESTTTTNTIETTGYYGILRSPNHDDCSIVNVGYQWNSLEFSKYTVKIDDHDCIIYGSYHQKSNSTIKCLVNRVSLNNSNYNVEIHFKKDLLSTQWTCSTIKGERYIKSFSESMIVAPIKNETDAFKCNIQIDDSFEYYSGYLLEQTGDESAEVATEIAIIVGIFLSFVGTIIYVIYIILRFIIRLFTGSSGDNTKSTTTTTTEQQQDKIKIQ